MIRRIGEALVRKGIVSNEQLEAALAVQRDSGGRVGSILLRMGLVGETELCEMLAERMRARSAPPELLDRLEGTAPRLLPRKIVLKHRALPIRRVGRTLHVLVADHGNLGGLSSSTGLRIQAWIAPEVRVSRLLERHYGIHSSAVYAEVCPWRDRGSPGAPGSVTSTETVAEGFARLGERLLSTESPAEAVRMVLEHAARFMPACVFFRVQANNATVLAAHGSKLDAATLGRFVAPAWSGTPLELLVVGSSYRGPVPDAAPYRAFFRELGLEVPREIFLLPIHLTNRVFGIFMGASAPEQPLTCAQEVSTRLARMLVLALTLSVLKDKMRHAAREQRTEASS